MNSTIKVDEPDKANDGNAELSPITESELALVGGGDGQVDWGG